MITKLSSFSLTQLLCSLFLVIGCLFTATTACYASETSEPAIQSLPVNEGLQDFVETGELPHTTLGEADNYIAGKMYEIIEFLQNIGKPLCFLMGVVSVFIAIFGIVGDSDLIARGIQGVVVSAICYFAISYAPEAINLIQQWLAEGTEVFVN